MILVDRLISRSCRALSNMIGMRLPGGGAYRGARESETVRRCLSIAMSVPSRRFSPRPNFPHRCAYAAAMFFSLYFDNMRRPHEA